MRYYIVKFGILLFLINSQNSFSQAESSTMLFNIVNNAYQTGDYRLGLNRIQDLGIPLKKVEGKESSASAELDAWKALLLANIGKFDAYKTAQKSAIETLNKIKDKDLAYRRAITVLAKSFLTYGDYDQAQLWLKATPIVNQDSISLKQQFVQLECQISLGYYVKSISEINTILPSVNNLSSSNKALQTDYKLLKIRILNEMGKSHLANEELHKVHDWIWDNFTYQGGYKGQYYFLEGRIAESLNDNENAGKSYKKAITTGRSYYKTSAPFFAQVQERRVTNLYALHHGEEGQYWQNDQNINTVSYYGRKSIQYDIHKCLQLEVLINSGRWSVALNSLGRFSKNEKYFPLDHIERLKLNSLLYKIYLKNNKIEQADSLLKSNLDLALSKFGNQAPAYHFYLLEKARFDLNYTNNFSNLDPIYASSLFKTIKNESSEKHPLYYDYAYDLVKKHQLKEDYTKALDLINPLLSGQLENRNNSTYAEGLLIKADILTDLGLYLDAMNLYNEVIDTISKVPTINKKTLFASSYRKKALLEIEMGNWTQANISFEQSNTILQNNIFSKQTAPIEEIAELNISLGHYRKTEKELIKAINYKKSGVGEKHYSCISLFNKLAILYTLTGDFVKAKDNLNKSLDIATTLLGNESLESAEILLLYRNLYSSIGDYDNAEKSIQNAVVIFSKTLGKDNIRTAIPKSELALSILYKAGQEIQPYIATCEDLLNSSQTIIDKELGKETAIYAQELENAGMSYLLMNKLERADESISEALVIWKKIVGAKNLKIAQLDFVRGKINYHSSEYQNALQLFNSSREIYSEILNENHPSYLESLGMTARMNFILGNKKDAISMSEEVVEKSLTYINSVFSNLSERQKSQYWNKIKEDFEFYNTLAFTSYDEYPDMVGKVFDINLQTKAILLNASLKIKNQILASGDSVLISVYDEWTISKENLINAISMSEKQRAQEGLDINKLESEIESLEQYLGQQSTAFSNLTKKDKSHKWQDLKTVLSPQEQVIEIIAFRKFSDHFTDTIWYVGLAVNKDTKADPLFSINKNGTNLHEKDIHYYRSCMKFKMKDQLSYKAFWKPLDTLVQKKGTIYLSVDGVYNKLNVESLRLPENGFIINKYAIAQIGTSRDLLDYRKSSTNTRNNSAFFVGNPNFYSPTFTDHPGWPQLPGTEEEINYLSTYLKDNKWDVNVYMNAEATEAKIKAIQSPKVFHIATHGFYEEKSTSNDLDGLVGKAQENPLLRSGIMLSNGGEIHQTSEVFEFNKTDGILTAYEAMSLSLENTDLVVLSACETGLGQVELGEGVFGLQRAFVVAGAKTIIISLFKVSDDVTMELMKKFYQEWLKSGNKRTAFIDAKKEIMQKYNNPMLWGAFVMQGVE